MNHKVPYRMIFCLRWTDEKSSSLFGWLEFNFHSLRWWKFISIVNKIRTFKALSLIFQSNIAKWFITNPVFWHRPHNVPTFVSDNSKGIVPRVFYVIFNTSAIENVTKDTISNFVISWNDLSYAIISLTRTCRTAPINWVFDRPVSPCLTCWCAFVWHSTWIRIRVTLTSTSVTCYIFIVMVKVGNGIFVKWLIVVAQVRRTLNTFRCSIWIEGISDFIWKDSFIGWSISKDFWITIAKIMIAFFHDRVFSRSLIFTIVRISVN